MRNWVSTLLAFLLFHAMYAQGPAMADQMRSDGKIYVVVGVVVLIFLVLFGYMIYLDNRLRKVEKENKG